MHNNNMGIIMHLFAFHKVATDHIISFITFQ